MRVNRDPTGRFAEKPFYSDRDFERITSSALAGEKLLPKEPEAIRIERFIEKRFDVAPQYEELPPGVLGMAVFSAKSGVEGIAISRDLDDGTPIGERRVRTTLAHEAGHGLLHTHLFVLQDGTKPLFGDFSVTDAPRILCRDNQIDDGVSPSRPKYEWWEWQANRAMSCLLMPERLVATAAEPFLDKSGMLGIGSDLRPDRLEAAARSLAEIFDVNPIVARIRLQQLFPQTSGQRSL